MIVAVISKQLAVKQRTVFFSTCMLLTACCLFACSIPNLEPPECTESRGVVKEFYSFHFGNDMKLSPENLKQREKFLTPELVRSLQDQQTENDVFTTNSPDHPKAFRTAACEVVSAEKTVFEIVLFWGTDERSEQKEIKVETIKKDGKWLIDKIIN